MNVQQCLDEERADIQAEARKELGIQVAAEIEKRKAAARQRRLDASNLVVAEERKYRTIDAVVEDIPDIIATPKSVTKRQKRPPNWEDIAMEAQIYGNRQALKNFPADFEGTSDTAKYQRLHLWKKDIASRRVISVDARVRLPSYGTDIDLQVLADCNSRRDVGLSIDDVILRRILKVRLTEAGKGELLRENGGSYDYGHSWAMRF